jgi:hypothetical protein
MSTAFALTATLLSQVSAAPPVPPAPAPAQPAAPAPPAAPAQRDPNAQLADMPWFERLGMRSLGVETRLPVVDRVVLVPDEATYIDEIAHWTPKARWPVLFDDDAFAPRFVRGFKPAQVVRRTAVAGPTDAAALRKAVDSAIARAWGGDPAQGSVAAMRALSLVPAGIVAASVTDPSWTGALALAAGRGEPLFWIEDPMGGTANDVLDARSFAALDASVRSAFSTSGLKWELLGDDLDAFTLCRHGAMRVDLPVPPGGRNPQLPKDVGPYALTDALCRNPDGSRYAFAAQLFGNRGRAAYMAMCSLFLHRSEAWMFDGYAKRTGGPFQSFGFGQSGAVLAEQGFTSRSWQGNDGTLAQWRALLPKGIACDLLFMNSSGNADFFEVEPGTVAWSTDIPVLRRPVALAMNHSFSLQAADAGWTVGGRWLDHGVYAYVGSVHEPYLSAFVPPAVVIQRLSALTPFLIAGRQWPGDPIPQVWRIATVGDPLMTVPAPKTIAMLPGREPAPAPAAGETDVRAAARSSLERVKTADAAGLRAAIADAMRDLVLAGDDALAAQLWKLAKSKGAGDAVARAALGPIFRASTRADFMDAWSVAKDPSAEEIDMLWSLWSADLPTLQDRAALAVLKNALRQPRIDMDAQALLPALRAAEGKQAAAAWVNELVGRTPDVESKRRLVQLAGNS